MSLKVYLPYLLVMAVTTYLVRALPYVLIRKKIKNRFIRSFMEYIPYAVLAAMTFPAILYSTSAVASAAVGFVVALVMAYFNQGLFKVALSACGTVLIVEFFMTYVI